jgi:alkylhydroperoxidase/carboxymuconolactone decarboxylase family protein YurZ
LDDKLTRAEEVIEKMRHARGGSVYEQWEWAARLDPDFMETYDAFSSQMLRPSYPRALEPKVHALIRIVLFANRGLTSTLEGHMRNAMELGATAEEILEALEAAVLPSGAPTMFIGMEALMKIQKEDATG